MENFALIKLLADGEYHSGDELGGVLGVSRTAVWKQLKKIEQLELPIESVKGKGYRVVGGLDLLDKDQIMAGLAEGVKAGIKTLHILNETLSTNALAMAEAQQGDADGNVWLAERQLAGKGRRGRVWQSPFGRNIYLSLVWGFQEGATSIEGLSLAVGVAVRRAIENLGISEIAFKWPNDLLHNGRKIAGILLEVTGDPADYCQVVIGVGLNVDMGGCDVQSIDQPWTDLAALASQQSQAMPSRNRVAAEMLNQLLTLLEAFRAQGFAIYRQEWEKSDSCRDQRVVVSRVNSDVQGIARGVTDSGALRLEVDGEIETIHGGEVSLRRQRDT